MSELALEREPETVEARSDCELTVASGRASCSAVYTAEMSSLEAACTYTVDSTSPAPERVCATSSGM